MRKRRETGGEEPGLASADLYLKDIRKYTPLSREEEGKLLLAARKGDRSALNRLITANLRFVVRVAGEHAGRGLSVSDLIAEGNLGLIRATQTFDPKRGLKFITYAVWWIRQAMRAALNRQAPLVAFPVNQIEDADRVSREARRLSHALGRWPNLDELLRSTRMNPRRLRRALEAGRPTRSLDHPIYDGGDVRYGDTFPDSDPGPDERLDDARRRRLLRDSLKELPDRDAKVLSLYFGLDTDEPASLEAVGRRFQISRERVRQIKDRALHKLRQRMALRERPELAPE